MKDMQGSSGKTRHRSHQIHYKEVVLGVPERGLFRGMPAKVRFPKVRWRENFLSDYVDAIDEHLTRLDIDRHDLHSTMSSQAFGLQLVAPFLNDPASMVPVLQAVLSTQGDDSVAQVHKVEVEYDADNRYLGERKDARRGGYRTNSDLAIWWTTQGGQERLLLVEVKYMEDSFGQCGTGRRRGGACDSEGASLAEDWWATCPLKASGRRYFDLAQSLDVIKTAESADSLACAFRFGLYQLMRNQVQAAAIEADPDSGVDRCDFAVLLHPDNDVVRRLAEPVAGHDDALDAFRAILHRPTDFLELDARTWLNAGGQDKALSDWSEALLMRYFPGDDTE
jgi:hypothetical protein